MGISPAKDGNVRTKMKLCPKWAPWWKWRQVVSGWKNFLNGVPLSYGCCASWSILSGSVLFPFSKHVRKHSGQHGRKVWAAARNGRRWIFAKSKRETPQRRPHKAPLRDPAHGWCLVSWLAKYLLRKLQMAAKGYFYYKWYTNGWGNRQLPVLPV